MLTTARELPTATIEQLADMLGGLEDKSTLIPELVETSGRTLDALGVIRDELYGEERVSHGELVAVLYLLTHNPMSLSALGEGIHLSRAAITALADRLETVGAAVRVNDPADRRRILFSIDAMVRTRLIGAFQIAAQARAEAEAVEA